MAKRGNGEGSIFKRANGRWYSALTYRDDFGEVKRREVSGRTQAEVRAKLREIRDRVEAGAPVKDAATTVGRVVGGLDDEGAAGERPQAGHHRPVRDHRPHATWRRS